MKAQAEWTARTEGPVVAYSASKRDKVIGIGLSAKHQGQRSYQTALTGRRHDCTRPAKLKHRRNHLAKRAPSRHDATPGTVPMSPGSGLQARIVCQRTSAPPGEPTVNPDAAQQRRSALV